MFSKAVTVSYVVFTVVFGSAALLSQQTSAAPGSSLGLELPVVMRQSVAAGKTPAGTKVQANLVVSTLVDSVVIPRGAVLSGEVTESAAKTKTEASRLAIRMDSAQWKNGSAPIKLYLTAWYYPAEAVPAPNLSYEPPDAATSIKNWNGMGQYPDKRDPASTPGFPGPDTGKDSLTLPSSITSKRRALMKNVDSTRNNDGAVILTSNRANIKIDKLTTYVLAKDDLLPARLLSPSRKADN
jgi:hypothetical protein